MYAQVWGIRVYMPLVGHCAAYHSGFLNVTVVIASVVS